MILIDNKTLKKAFNLAQSIRETPWRSLALCHIAVALSRTDLQQANEILALAIDTAQDTERIDFKAEAMSKAAAIWAPIEPQKAELLFTTTLHIVKTTNDSPSDRSKEDMVARITLEWAKTNPQRALDVIKIIDPSGSRELDLWTIAEEWAKFDPQKALDLAKSIKSDYTRERALIPIVTSWAKLDPQKAFSIAKDIKARSERDSALKNLASIWVEMDLQNAIDVAQSIKDEKRRVQALTNIGAACAETAPHQSKGILNVAFNIAKSIREEFSRALALSHVAIVWTKTDRLRAESILKMALEATRVEKTGVQITQYEIVEMWVQTDKQTALEIAQYIDDSRSIWKAFALRDVAAVWATTDQQRANEIFTTAIESAQNTKLQFWKANQYRSARLRDILSVWAKSDAEAALGIIPRIEYNLSWSRDETFCNIVRAMSEESGS